MGLFTSRSRRRRRKIQQRNTRIALCALLLMGVYIGVQGTRAPRPIAAPEPEWDISVSEELAPPLPEQADPVSHAIDPFVSAADSLVALDLVREVDETLVAKNDTPVVSDLVAEEFDDLMPDAVDQFADASNSPSWRGSSFGGGAAGGGGVGGGAGGGGGSVSTATNPLAPASKDHEANGQGAGNANSNSNAGGNSGNSGGNGNGSNGGGSGGGGENGAPAHDFIFASDGAGNQNGVAPIIVSDGLTILPNDTNGVAPNLPTQLLDAQAEQLEAPEPASLMLVGSGLIVAASRLRRRKS